MTGRKDDAEKPLTYLLPGRALLGVSAVLAHGAKKYGPRNWELGMAHSRLLSAALRHLFALMSGEENDPESGLPHIDHAACCLLMLSEYRKRGVGTNDLKPLFER